MGYLKIENTLAQQENYDDIAKAHGWAGKKYTINNGEVTEFEQTSQQFIADMYKQFSDDINARTCQYNESLYGRLNYDAAQMIEAFKQTTNVEWINE